MLVNFFPQFVIYEGCSLIKYHVASPYEMSVNSLLSSISKSNSYRVSCLGSSPLDTVYGLSQCRGNLSTSGCRDCVSHSMSRLVSVCKGLTGGVLQLNGCLVKYDNVSFIGVEDKAVLFKKCGTWNGYDTQPC